MPASHSLDSLIDQEYMPVMYSQKHSWVVFRKLADIDLDEPTYQTRGDDDSSRATIPLDEFLAAIEPLPWPQRPRIICHTGRCGSTLLTNMIALSSSTIVLREPRFLNDALLGDLRVRQSDTTATWGFTLGALKYCAYVASSLNRLIVIKATSWATVDLLCNVWPLTGGTWLSLWRDPAEVVASQFYDPPRWSRNSAVLSATSTVKAAESGARWSQLELFVAMWCRAAEAFIASSQAQCLFSYDQLASDPRATLDVADRWLGITDSPHEDPKLDEVLGRYSKDHPGHARPWASVPRRTLPDPDRRQVTEATDSLVSTLTRLSVSTAAGNQSLVDHQATAINPPRQGVRGLQP
jgi:hypothetical protein